MAALLKSSIFLRIVSQLLLVLATVPLFYILFAIQYSAITVPFWDHTELIRWITPLYDGTFRFSSLWAPHNHTRPFVYRLVMAFNAVATDWDVRSEYTYMYLSLYGTFACHAWLIVRLLKNAPDRTALPAMLLLSSLIVFSPVGHNNHWWSMMFQLNGTNFFIALAFVLTAVWPMRWSSHVVAAVSCWLAAFTLTNGFFAMLAVIVVCQLSALRMFRPDRFAVFWIVNLVVAALCYLPGMTMDASPTHPGIGQLVVFTLAYLGAPFAGLLWFPFQNMFDLPMAMAPNLVAGCALVIGFLALGLDAWPRRRARNPAATVLFSFAGFAVVSAVATGWARAAFDEAGLANANSSRYTIFGAYLMLGQLYYVFAGLNQGWWPRLARGTAARHAVLLSTTVFVTLAFVTYGRATRVYADAHQFNKKLEQAYIWGLQPTAADKFVAPDLTAVLKLKQEMQRIEIGPYGNRPYLRVPLSVGKFSRVALLSANRKINQRFVASEAGLKNITFKFVTPAGKVSPGRVSWQLREAGSSSAIASGGFEADRARDWAEVTIKLPYIGDSKGKTYELTFDGAGDDARPLALPLYALETTGNAPVVLSEDSVTRPRDAVTMDLTTGYVQ